MRLSITFGHGLKQKETQEVFNSPPPRYFHLNGHRHQPSTRQLPPTEVLNLSQRARQKKGCASVTGTIGHGLKGRAAVPS